MLLRVQKDRAPYQAPAVMLSRFGRKIICFTTTSISEFEEQPLTSLSVMGQSSYKQVGLFFTEKNKL
jgi:hypothetical protein